MKALALCSYPKEAAATRFRLEQFVEPLRAFGIELTISPFLDSAQFRDLYQEGNLSAKAARMVGPLLKRITETISVGKYDLIIVQREALFFGPGTFEWLFSRVRGVPMVLDLDDATYVRYDSPTYGRIGSLIKFFGKTDKLIDRSRIVICGNRFIADYVNSRGTRAVIIPTVVDLDVFRPRQPATHDGKITIGWIGTHSTFPFLESLFPVIERLAREHEFVMKIVGSGRRAISLNGVKVENIEWSLENEVEDFRTLDIGLYPITTSTSASDEWIRGKSGFKAIQYMAVGVPFVMSPVGVGAEVGTPGSTHFNAVTHENWYDSLHILLTDSDARSRMGATGREYAERYYGLPQQARIMAETLLAIFREGYE